MGLVIMQKNPLSLVTFTNMFCRDLKTGGCVGAVVVLYIPSVFIYSHSDIYNVCIYKLNF